MRIRGAPAGWAALLTLLVRAHASAQVPPPIQSISTSVPGSTLADTVTRLVRPAGATHVGEAIGLATALEVATAPFAAVSGGFVIKLDPTTGLQVRTATTFGPFFAENALTSGEGNVVVGVNYSSATYDRLGARAMNALALRSLTAASLQDSRSGVANLDLTANTLVVAGRIGVTDNLDIGLSVPVVTLKLNGTSSLATGNGNTIRFASSTAVATGLGDIAGLVKYRFLAFSGGEPDPGGLTFVTTMRLPTGDRENLRGLGMTRTLAQLVASSGQGRFRPHGNVGFEWWSKGVSVTSDYAQNATVTARHQFTYGAGFEYEAAPKITLLADLMGRHIFGGGRVDVIPGPGGVTFSQFAAALPEGISKLALAPGVKVNLKGTLLLSVNVLVALQDTGLHAQVTPVAGLELAFK